MTDPTTEPDLSEFTDPALYDAENRWAADDEFYLALARETGRPVLDLACGTGRLARAIAAAGLAVVGVDLTEAMLERAKALDREGRVTWVHGDMRRLDLDRRFAFAFMNGHAWQCLLTDGDQRACLDGVAQHLQAGGRFAFESRNPAARLADGVVRTTRNRFRDAAGHKVEAEAVWRFDPATAVDHVTVARVTPATGARQDSTIALRYTEQAALAALLQASGFKVLHQYGDWDRTPVAAASPEIITVCRRV